MRIDAKLVKVILFLILPTAFVAAQPQRPIARTRTESGVIAEIMEQLSSNDAAQRQQAMETIRMRMNTRGLVELRSIWLKALLTAKQYPEASALAMEGILANPWETKSIEAVLSTRIKALLATGKTDEALACAKSLFNVSTMAGTSDAILTVAECLNVAKPTDKDIFTKFRDEQIAGATTQPTKDRTISTVLAAIKIDPKPYDEALKKLTGEDAQSLLGRGNLLLLADRPKEAKLIFDRLYSLTTADLAEASEALARTMKAEDGTIARANAWIISIRPKK
jgi:tetratricopeptide (TPR) repeat protein